MPLSLTHRGESLADAIYINDSEDEHLYRGSSTENAIYIGDGEDEESGHNSRASGTSHPNINHPIPAIDEEPIPSTEGSSNSNAIYIWDEEQGSTAYSDRKLSMEARQLHTGETAVRFREVALEDLVCPICLDINFQPFVLSCGHSFCVHCLNKLRQGAPHPCCPICRAIIEHRPVLCFALRAAARALISGKDTTQFTERELYW